MRVSSCRVHATFPFLSKFLGLLAATITVALLLPSCLHAQVSGSISGTVLDSSSAPVPGATVQLMNEASKESREVASNNSGYFTFSAVLPATYTVTVEQKGFKLWKQTGIVIHTEDVRTLSDIRLSVGAITETIEVTATTAAVPVDSGALEDVLSQRDIQDLPLESRNVSELIKVLPGVNNQNGSSNGAGYMNFLNAGATGSDVGVGLAINGAAYRGGTAFLNEGADILDPGCNCWGLATIEPRMTQEVQIQTSNFGADVQKGPTVINTIGKSGTNQYHGSLWFDARNDALNPNDWVDNHNGIPRGFAHYYYPGGEVGGPIPFTHKKAFFWFGYDHFLQNLGNANKLQAYIPAPGMTQGNFTSSGQGVAQLCPNLDANGNDTSGGKANGTACASINGMVLPDGTTVTNGIIPSQYLDPGATALEKIWPAANVNPASNGGNNYLENVPSTHDGYIYRMRFDYHLNDSNMFFVSYQYGTDSALAAGTGAHVWYDPGNNIPFPGGGLVVLQQTRTATGHFVHVFNPSTTNEFVAAWGWANEPTTASLKAVSTSTLGYPYTNAFHNSSITMIPSWNGTNFAFPDFSQADLFEQGSWITKKQTPSFADNFTKVWRTHTIKVGGYYENTGNVQSSFSTSNYANGVFSFGGAHPDYLNTLTGKGYQGAIGATNNPTADFVTGIASFYGQVNSAPYQDMAYRTISGYVNDSWKTTRRLTLQLGLRLDHMGRWYDRSPGGVGMAAFYPNLVTGDETAGLRDPGIRYHAIDHGVPLSGSPVQSVFLSPRVGAAYDLFGSGKIVLRGGWGRYYWNDQVNDYLGTLQTAQPILGVSLQSGFQLLESQIPNLPVPSASAPSVYSTPNAAPNTSTIYATDPNDRAVPYTDSYNFTVSQETRWKTIFQIGYVGNRSRDVLMGGQNIGYSTGGDIINRNRMPLGALFGPDPITGLVAADPQNPGNTCGTVHGSAYCNNNADYQPFGIAYGSTPIYVPEHEGWSNYNALQIEWIKPTGAFSYNLNYTWSQALGTSLGTDPFSVAGNYGELNIQRPHVINGSFSYRVPIASLGGSRIARDILRDWTVGGFFTWQTGADMAAPNNISPNLNFTYSYTNFSSGSNSIGAPTYFGTTASKAIMPVLTCNPTGSAIPGTVANLKCFAPPAFGTNGNRTLPYIPGPTFWDSDLSIARAIRITERQSVEIRALATNWLNHPLATFSSNNQLKLNYTRDFVSGVVTAAPQNTTGTAWGQVDYKVGQPNERVVMLSATYKF